jgi:hypothetical protein
MMYIGMPPTWSATLNAEQTMLARRVTIDAMRVLYMRCFSHSSQDLDGEFVNQLTTKEDLREGRAQLLIDNDGNAMVPRPEGVIDEEDDWEEMAQLEGLGQGGWCYTFHVTFVICGICCSEERVVFCEKNDDNEAEVCRRAVC